MDKVKISNDPCDLDLSSWKWCATHLHLMRFMYATHEVILSNRDEATEPTGPKLEKTHVTLTFGPENGAWHISPSCAVWMPHIKWFCQIMRKPWSKHNKNFKSPMWPSFQMTGVTLTFDLLSWKWIATHCHIMDCICAKYEADRSNRHGAVDTTKTSNDPCDYLSMLGSKLIHVSKRGPWRHDEMLVNSIITHAPVHITDFKGVRARYVKRTG